MTEAKTALEQKWADAKKVEEEVVMSDEVIPQPVGYHLLIALPQIEETFNGSKIVKASNTIRTEEILSMVGSVIAMGDQAYNDESRFPTGPWCKVGDYVMFRANTGTRFKIGKQEFRLMNDDSIQAVVEDPRHISRAS